MRIFFAVACLFCLSPAVHAEDNPPLPVVSDLDLSQVFGKYYEIGTYLQWVEKGCSNSTITFSQRSDPNSAALLLECDRGWFKQKIAGEAIPMDPSVLARTTATFHPPVGGDVTEEFDIIMVGDAYAWLVVGHPNRKLLWIFSRTAAMSTSTLTNILDRLASDFAYTGVYEQLTCTKHKGVPENLCKDALHPASSWLRFLLHPAN